MNSTTGIKKPRGSTLVGALVSTLILSIGMAALSRLYINNSLNSHYSQHAATALAYARDKIESLRYQASNSTMTTGSEQLEDQDLTYRRDWQISPNPVSDYRTISITVQWHDSSGDHRIGLKTLIGDQTVESLTFANQ